MRAEERRGAVDPNRRDRGGGEHAAAAHPELPGDRGRGDRGGVQPKRGERTSRGGRVRDRAGGDGSRGAVGRGRPPRGLHRDVAVPASRVRGAGARGREARAVRSTDGDGRGRSAGDAGSLEGAPGAGGAAGAGAVRPAVVADGAAGAGRWAPRDAARGAGHVTERERVRARRRCTGGNGESTRG